MCIFSRTKHTFVVIDSFGCSVHWYLAGIWVDPVLASSCADRCQLGADPIEAQIALDHIASKLLLSI